MSARDIRNLPASIRARLTTLARERGEVVDATFVAFARERFLYRLQYSDHVGTMVLKGASLFPVWEGSLHRATRDSDFLSFGDSSTTAVAALVRDICMVSPPV